MHLAGYTDMGTYLFDTHGAPVSDAVWRLYAHAVERFGAVSTLVEWDTAIPSFQRLCAEAEQARAIAEEAHERKADTHAARVAAMDGRADRQLGTIELRVR
jgi:uncharacterized protein (UPF0276 family)